MMQKLPQILQRSNCLRKHERHNYESVHPLDCTRNKCSRSANAPCVKPLCSKVKRITDRGKKNQNLKHKTRNVKQTWHKSCTGSAISRYLYIISLRRWSRETKTPGRRLLWCGCLRKLGAKCKHVRVSWWTELTWPDLSASLCLCGSVREM